MMEKIKAFSEKYSLALFGSSVVLLLAVVILVGCLGSQRFDRRSHGMISSRMGGQMGQMRPAGYGNFNCAGSGIRANAANQPAPAAPQMGDDSMPMPAGATNTPAR